MTASESVGALGDGQQAINRLIEQFPQAVAGEGSFRNQHWVEVRAEHILDVAGWLKSESAESFDLLTDLTAVHWPDEEQPMELVYHLYSVARNDRLRIKVRTGDTGPVPSLGDVWKSALWNEREVFDMFGIRFDGHPDLRRILMPDDYTDHPLRKEFPLYRG